MMTMIMKAAATSAALLALVASVPTLVAQAVISGPIGPSPYDVVRGWHKPFAQPGFAFGGNSGVFAESPNRIFIAQRGEARLPDPVPPEFAGYAGSIGINVLNATERRVWRNCLYTLDGNGNVKERWTQWDHLCEGSAGPGPHRLRISPYDPERRVWLVNETFHQIYVISNDGTTLLKTLGEKNVPGSDATHFARPQDVAFLPEVKKCYRNLTIRYVDEAAGQTVYQRRPNPGGAHPRLLGGGTRHRRNPARIPRPHGSRCNGVLVPGRFQIPPNRGRHPPYRL